MTSKYLIKSIIAFAVVAVSTTSCEKVLDKQQPVSQISDNVFWKSNSDASLGVAAIYDNMQKTYRLKHILWGEYRSDNFILTNFSSDYSINLINNTINPSANNEQSLRWNTLFAMVNTANLAIDKIPAIPLYDQNFLGESYALRAYAYFDAVRVWGAAPIFKKPTVGIDGDAIVAKSDGATVIAEIVLPDMVMAEQLITTPTHRYRFSKASILLFQANVYTYLKDYVKAKAAIDKFLALNVTLGNVYKLTTTRADWQKLFLNDAVLGKLETGPELIFSIKYDILEDGNRASGIYELMNAGSPQVYLSPLLENKWIAKFPITEAEWKAKYPGFIPKTNDPVSGLPLYGDWRYFECRETGRVIGNAKIEKYSKGAPNLADDDTDVIIYRYAGVLLLKALIENKINFSNKQISIDLVNQVRVARQLPTVTAASFTTQEELENFILDERQLELLGEGHRWWDLINMDKAVQVMGPINGQTPDRLLYPIYFKHLIDNPKLVQTPGYN